MCTNLTGTQKVELAIIGKSNKPMCFKNLEGKDRPMPYFSQKNAWSDTGTFEKWFKEVFLPHVRKHVPDPQKKVLLIIDNCGPHGTEQTWKSLTYVIR